MPQRDRKSIPVDTLKRRWLCIQGEVGIIFILKYPGLPCHICWPFTGCICSNHDVKSNYHYGALWTCEAKTAGVQFFLIMLHIPEGQLKDLRVTDLWKCHPQNVSGCLDNRKQKECEWVSVFDFLCEKDHLCLHGDCLEYTHFLLFM